jgi:PadR family transcriptional regulator
MRPFVIKEPPVSRCGSTHTSRRTLLSAAGGNGVAFGQGDTSGDLRPILRLIGEDQARLNQSMPCDKWGYLCRIRAMRMTHAQVQVALALLDRPNDKYWGYDLSRRFGVRSGIMYPLLTRMLDEGWLTDGWEDPAMIEGERPPRRYYELTDEGCNSVA